jgi:hypothetical protein
MANYTLSSEPKCFDEIKDDVGLDIRRFVEARMEITKGQRDVLRSNIEDMYRMEFYKQAMYNKTNGTPLSADNFYFDKATVMLAPMQPSVPNSLEFPTINNVPLPRSCDRETYDKFLKTIAPAKILTNGFQSSSSTFKSLTVDTNFNTQFTPPQTDESAYKKFCEQTTGKYKSYYH